MRRATCGVHVHERVRLLTADCRTAGIRLHFIISMCHCAMCSFQEQQLQPPPPPPEATNYCYLCESNVHKRSKHCRKCNKCVEAFDHHCPWLNTCVGAVNYRHFLSLLVAALSLVTLQIGSFVQSGVLLFQEPERSRYGMPPAAYGALLVAILVPLLLGWLMLTQLLTFHAALISRGLTTYEFIIAQRDKQRALDMATGSGASVGWRAKRAAWINRNAPCLAVCELCDESPAPRPHPARSESARRRGLSGSNLRKQVVATSRQATATSAVRCHHQSAHTTFVVCVRGPARRGAIRTCTCAPVPVHLLWCMTRDCHPLAGQRRCRGRGGAGGTVVGPRRARRKSAQLAWDDSAGGGCRDGGVLLLG